MQIYRLASEDLEYSLQLVWTALKVLFWSMT